MLQETVTSADLVRLETLTESHCEEEFEIEDIRYSVTPEGSEFYHCTPDILGQFCNTILHLNFARVMLEKVELFYHWLFYNDYESTCAPCLKFTLLSETRTEKYRFTIGCSFCCVHDSGGPPIETLPLPDFNKFTIFYEYESSIAIHFSSTEMLGATKSEATLTLKNKYKTLDIESFNLWFSLEQIAEHKEPKTVVGPDEELPF